MPQLLAFPASTMKSPLASTAFPLNGMFDPSPDKAVYLLTIPKVSNLLNALSNVAIRLTMAAEKVVALAAN
jgi:hypothetical protein